MEILSPLVAFSIIVLLLPPTLKNSSSKKQLRKKVRGMIIIPLTFFFHIYLQYIDFNLIKINIIREVN